ncbi:MAG: ABC transporter ATP-binding protein [Candidatus Eisenbacteria bacterium]
MLRAELKLAQARFLLDASLRVERGETLVVVGESGAGKSTLLRLIAGLASPDRGTIRCDEEVWFSSTDGAEHGRVPAWRRDVGYVPQEYALFPHLSVAENIGFGLRARGDRATAIATRVDELLEMLKLGELRGRRPATLSGGQAQRVALARALALAPRVLLLDEPMAALDTETRRSVRGELRQILSSAERATILVTHDPIEAVMFGDQILVLEAGKVTQSGSSAELLRHPRTPYVGQLLGANLFRGRLERASDAADARPRVRTGEGTIVLSRDGEAVDTFAVIDPREIVVHLHAPEGSAQNVFTGPIVELVPEPPFGETVRVVIGSEPVLVAEVTQSVVGSLGLAPGRVVHAAFKATGVRSYN